MQDLLFALVAVFFVSAPASVSAGSWTTFLGRPRGAPVDLAAPALVVAALFFGAATGLVILALVLALGKAVLSFVDAPRAAAVRLGGMASLSSVASLVFLMYLICATARQIVSVGDGSGWREVGAQTNF